MSYGEAWRLTLQLMADPTSHVAAAVQGWEFPASWEYLALADLIDVTIAVNRDGKGPAQKPYRRPWIKPTRAIGEGTSLTVPQYRALRARLEKEGDARG
jgi:hypothetical protein